MTTTVTVRTADHSAYVVQSFKGVAPVEVEVSPNSEMTFHAHSHMNIAVSEESMDDAPILDAEWFRRADHYQGETLIRKGKE